MLIKPKRNDSIAYIPPMRESQGYCEVRATCTWTELPTTQYYAGNPNVFEAEYTTYHQTFVDSKRDLDKIRNKCQNITILFEDGTNIQWPLEVFLSEYEVLPDGELTGALYGE